MKKILIVEDDKILAKALKLKLTSVGFSVSNASNGEEGLELLNKEKFDFIICDLIMPKMDGFTFLEKLRGKKIEIPVLVLTNLGQKEDKDRVRQFKPVKFFVKSDIAISKVANYIVNFLEND